MILFYGLLAVFFCGELACKEGSKVHAAKDQEKKGMPVRDVSFGTQNLIEEDTIPPSNHKVIRREVDGKTVTLSPNGEYKWQHPEQENKATYFIEEVYPKVVYYNKFLQQKIVNADSPDDTVFYKQVVPDRVEFFDSNYNVLKIFDIDEHNPYLKVSNDVWVRPYYNDSEKYGFLSKKQQTKEYLIKEHHTRTVVENQDGFVKINYYNRFVTEERWVVDVRTTTLVLDKQGREVFRKEYNGLCSTPAVSLNGEFLLISILPDESVYNEMSFEVWDLQSKAKFYERKNADPDLWLNGIEAKGSTLRVEYTYLNSKKYDSFQLLFDTKNLKLFQKRFTKNEWQKVGNIWKEIDGDFLRLLDYFSFEEIEIN